MHPGVDVLRLMSMLGLLLAACTTDELAFYPPDLPSGRVGDAYSATVRISNNDTPIAGSTIVEGAVPPGLAFSGVEAGTLLNLQGTPTRAGTYPFRLEVHCFGTNTAGQRGARDYEIVIE